MSDLLSQLAELENVEIFLELCRRSQFAEDLADGTYTVFAPTDKAFTRLPEPLFRALWSGPEEILIDVLEHHLVPGIQLDRLKGQGRRARRLRTVQGSQVELTPEDYDGAAFSGPLLRCKNGVIRRVNQVGCPSYGVPSWPVELRLRWAFADLENDRSLPGPRTLRVRDGDVTCSHTTVSLH